MADNYRRDRRQMVQRQLVKRGIRDERVIRAMGIVPREHFVPANLQAQAYDDGPLPIGEGQTISQPYIVAFMLESLGLQGNEKVLEVGTGSGYAAAVLSQLVDQVVTIERKPELASRAVRALDEAGMTNVTVNVGDGSLGCPAEAPFEGIVVAAGGPEVPNALIQQLKTGGRLVMPVGPQGNQQLVRLTQSESGQPAAENLAAVRFVPLIGRQGWSQ